MFRMNGNQKFRLSTGWLNNKQTMNTNQLFFFREDLIRNVKHGNGVYRVYRTHHLYSINEYLLAIN